MIAAEGVVRPALYGMEIGSAHRQLGILGATGAWHEARASTKAATGSHFGLKTCHTTAVALGPPLYG